MAEIRYIHAADIHLDAPFAGLSREISGKKLGSLLHEATFTALERLVRLCEARRPHFLTLAGDIYNQENASIKAQLRLRDACERLKDMGIMVFIAHGNHDPASSLMNSIRWPDNVFIFPSNAPQTLPYAQDGETLALVHGISHDTQKDARNLAKMFKREDSDCFQLGILHCSVDNVASDRYAPCSLQDLIDSGLDAWALGHAHERRVLCQKPFIAYSGSAQGLHVNEPGPRGCMLVTATSRPDGWVCAPEFHTLGPLQWDKIQVNLEGVDSVSGIEEKVNSAISVMIDEADPAIQGSIVRVNLYGRTPMNSWLRKRTASEDLAELTTHFSALAKPVFIKDFEIDTTSESNPGEYLAREDLLGEVMRICRSLRENPEFFVKMRDEACTPLYAKAGRSKLLPELDEEQLQKILGRAEYLCQEILESK